MMEISLRRSKNLLCVLFDDDEVVAKHLEGGLFRSRYGCSRGMAFTFEKSEKGFFLYVNFDRYKDPGVLSQIASGQPVGDLRVLSDLAHLPGAKIYSSNVPLPDGRNADLIETVRFELRKVREGVWEAGGIESEVDQLRRQMRLKSLKEGLPGIYIEQNPDTLAASQAEPAQEGIIFTDKVAETERGTRLREMCQKGEDTTSERALESREQPIDLPTEAEPRVDAPIVPEKRDPSEIAECDGCEKLYCEGDLTEVRPGLFLCTTCRVNPRVVTELGLAPDELIGIGNKMCDDCRQIFDKNDLTMVEPGRWLCRFCMSAPGWNRGFRPDTGLFPAKIAGKKEEPTKERLNQHGFPYASCPIGPVSEFEEDSRSCYFAPLFNRPYRGRYKPGWEDWREQTIFSSDRIEFRGEAYNPISGPKVVWEQAEDDAYRLSRKPGDNFLSPRHFHANFEFRGQRIHIDYLKFSHEEPWSVIMEFLVFCDGRFITRGGNCEMPPFRRRFKWPLTAPISGSLINIEGPLKVTGDMSLAVLPNMEFWIAAK